MMNITDINGKARRIKSLKTIVHQVPDRISGELLGIDYVEVEILGKIRTWVEWYPLAEFRKLNPGIKI